MIMTTRQRRRTNRARFIAPVATLFILGYFGFHAFNGQYGIRAHLVLESRIPKLEGELAALEDSRRKLQARIDLLKDGTIEGDMLDERIRHHLNMVRPDEIVIMRPRSS